MNYIKMEKPTSYDPQEIVLNNLQPSGWIEAMGISVKPWDPMPSTEPQHIWQYKDMQFVATTRPGSTIVSVEKLDTSPAIGLSRIWILSSRPTHSMDNAPESWMIKAGTVEVRDKSGLFAVSFSSGVFADTSVKVGERWTPIHPSQLPAQVAKYTQIEPDWKSSINSLIGQK